MKKLFVKLSVLAIMCILALACTKTGDFQHFVVVDCEDDETAYEVEYVSEIAYKKAEYSKREYSGRFMCFPNAISTFTTGNRSVLDRVKYTVTRKSGSGRCVLYIMSRSFHKKYEDIRNNGISDGTIAWIRENYIAKCVLEPEMQKASVKVLLN